MTVPMRLGRRGESGSSLFASGARRLTLVLSSPGVVHGGRGGVPSLSRNSVHIWSACRTRGVLNFEEQSLVLNEQENQRMKAMNDIDERKRFTFARCFLRSTLGHYIGCPARDIKFEYGAAGKPFLSDHPTLSFNLSHTNDYAAIAVTLNAQIGIDIEMSYRKMNNMERILKRKCTPREQREITSQSSDDERKLRFLSLWTRKEAFIKATGEGLRRSLTSFEVTTISKDDRNLVSIDGSEDLAKRWSMISFWPYPEVLGAVAVESDTIHRWESMRWELEDP